MLLLPVPRRTAAAGGCAGSVASGSAGRLLLAAALWWLLLLLLFAGAATLPFGFVVFFISSIRSHYLTSPPLSISFSGDTKANSPSLFSAIKIIP